MEKKKTHLSLAIIGLIIGALIILFFGTSCYSKIGTDTLGEISDSLSVSEDKLTTDGEVTSEAGNGTVESDISSAETVASEEDWETDEYVSELTFRNEKLLNQHYEKHGIEMGFLSPEEYEKAAAAVAANPNALHKTEAEDGDDVYYVEATNEFVIVSTDGYIRTYFNPSAGIDYFNRQ